MGFVLILLAFFAAVWIFGGSLETIGKVVSTTFEVLVCIGLAALALYIAAGVVILSISIVQ